MSNLTSILSSDLVSASRSTINTNYQSLNVDKVETSVLTGSYSTSSTISGTFAPKISPTITTPTHIGTSIFPTSNETALFTMDTSAGVLITILTTGISNIFGNAQNFSGFFMVNETALVGDTALFVVGGSGVVLITQSGTSFSTTADTASHFNVYAVAGVIKVQNLYNGNTTTIRVTSFRARNT